MIYIMGSGKYIGVARFFRTKMWEWQAGDPRRTQKEFADYLGVSQVALNKWYNGERTPDKESCESLSKILGEEVYIVCGYLPPDERLRDVALGWGGLAEYAKKEIEAIFENHDQRSVPLPDNEERAPRSKAQEVDPTME